MNDRRQHSRKLRLDGHSITHIAREVGASKSSVSVWVRDISLTAEQKQRLTDNSLAHRQQAAANANREKYRQLRRTYQNEGRERAQTASPLHMAGCMLYWAEGAKRRNDVYFVNSDPAMHQLFMRFLREEFAIPDEAVKIHIHCHTTDLDEQHRIERYWLKILHLPSASLMKTQVKQGGGSRRNVLINGVCGIRVISTPLIQHIYGAIQAYAGFERDEWLG